MPRLRRSDCAGPGLTRRRRGRGFEYLDTDGRRVTDPYVLLRIRELAIPPAWKDVWICPHPNGHLQAVGIDDAGRKQYLYHPQWRARRDQEKFDRMAEFARALPDVRATTSQHLRAQDLSRDCVLACAIRLLDKGFFRIGGEAYVESNETFGLATLRKEHVIVEDSWITFNFLGKGKKESERSLVDTEVAEVVKRLKRRRNGPPDLLAYKANGDWYDVKSADINQYLKDISGGDYSAKDFRTWHATVHAAIALAVSVPAITSVTARKRAVARAVKEVAVYLNNTPAVARSSYIDPRVIDRYQAGVTIAGVLPDIGDVESYGQPALQGRVEEAVLDLLEGVRSEDIEKVRVPRSA